MTTEIARLCRYYLECISQDMGGGVSVVARNSSGDPDYAQFDSVPIGSDVEWWRAPGVARLLGKVRAERGKLMLWLGYPVRLRKHRIAGREGFSVEPLLLWPMTLGETNADPPRIKQQAPEINTAFLRGLTMGDAMGLADEAARLSEELGLDASAGGVSDVCERVERLVRIWPEWDWRESIDPFACTTRSLADVSIAGIYNCAVVIPGELSPYTQGLEAELKSLSGVSEEVLKQTVLGRWMAADISSEARDVPGSEPLIEVLPMNAEQHAAVRAALTNTHTVITGPPGTGKSQVVTNMLVNAAWRGMRVLFASKNNKAVDVVEERVNGVGKRPVLLRLGSKEYQERLSGYFTQLLAGSPSAELQASYDDALQRHRSLAARIVELNALQQRTMDCRNEVDRLEADAEEGRAIFGDGFATMTAAIRNHALADLSMLRRAIDGIDREKHGLLVRLFWHLLQAGRARRLNKFVGKAAGTFDALKFHWATWQASDGIDVLRNQLSDLRQRAEMATKVVKYRETLKTLQRMPSFESIARRRTELAEQVNQNAVQLWREWVQLAPTRLTPTQRKDASDYLATVELMKDTDPARVHASVRKKARALQAKVTALFNCWGVTSLSAKGRIPLEPGYFDLVVIDEASQCDIASALPLLYRAKRSVIIGDPMQLRHISALSKARDSELQHEHGLVDNRLAWMYSVNSLFDLAATVVPSQNIINLRDHHRSHADIIGFSNEAFYEGSLRVATGYARLARPDANEPGIVWQDVAGRVLRPREGGAQNAEEARALVDALVDLLVERGYTGSVGVVTPFRAQAQLLQQLIRSRGELDSVAARAELLVDTVHKFQGDERDVMFFSPVVSNGISPGALGFLRGNGNLFNVAITRARGLLHVVGDKRAAASCGVDYLEAFANYVENLEASRASADARAPVFAGPNFPTVTHPERVSDWERVLYRAMVSAGLKPIPQFSVEQYDLDFAIIEANHKLAIEVDGERYHRSWTGELCLRDQLRNQRLIELGWNVQRFWVYEVRDDLEGCVRRVKEWVDGGSTDAA